jgi:adenine deaminase
MCTKPAFDVSHGLDQLRGKAHELGCELAHPFMTMSFLSLLVIPKLKIGDKGLFDVDKFRFVEVLSK